MKNNTEFCSTKKNIEELNTQYRGYAKGRHQYSII